MSNFTQSGGRVKFWQAITNLSCCNITGIKQLISMKAFAFIMLFAFSISTMYAQQQQQRSVEINRCFNDLPNPVLDLEDLKTIFGCDDPDATFTITPDAQGDDCGWEVIYTYVLKCGGEDFTFKEFFLGSDQSAPELTGTIPDGASGLNLCYGDIPAGPTEQMIADQFTDNCGSVIVSKSGQPTGTDCDWNVVYIYDVRDACDNVYLGEVKVEYSGGDTEAPYLVKDAVIPTGDLNSELCFANKDQGPTEEEIAALFGDNCGNVNVTKTSYSKGTDCKWLAVYTYTIVDDCENYAEEIVITYQGRDTTDPTLSGVPEDITVSCIDEIPSLPKDGPFADDNCDVDVDIELTVDNQVSELACEGGFMVRTWTATDDCGNTDVQSQTITVLPAPKAEFGEVPSDKTISCDEADGYQPESLGYSNGVSSGACALNGEAEGVVTGTFDECGGELTVTWTFSDECDYTITHVQTITVDPAPQAEFVNPPADISISCESAQQYVAASLGYSNGLEGVCGINGSVDGVLSGSFDSCGGTLYVDWKFTDNCGREITYQKEITVEPAPAPTLDEVSDMEMSCSDADVYVAGNLAYTNGLTEECLISGELTPVQTNNFDSCGGEITIVWEGEDVCGNPLYATKKITVLPAPAPTLDEVSDMEMSCSDADVYVAGNLAYSNGLEGTCNISGELTPVQTDAFDSCGGEITIVWEGYDVCGNPLYATKKITVLPAPAPTLDPVMDGELSCSDADVYVAGNLAYSNGLEGTCNISGELAPVQTNDFTECGGKITIVWEGEDVCGNPLYATKEITVLPAPQAEFMNVPETISIECTEAEVLEAGYLSYSNGLEGTCGINGEVLGVLSGEFTECGGLLFIDWSFTDDCDRTITHRQQIKVNPAPEAVFINPPADKTIECSEADGYVAEEIDYSNGLDGACGIYGKVNGVEAPNFTECGGEILVTWTFTDDCDRTITHVQTITVNPAPQAEFVNPPADISISCESAQQYVAASLGYSNGLEGVCGINGGVDGVLSGSFDSCGGTLYVDWKFTDNCGREITYQKEITVEPAPAPTLDEVSDMEMSCSDADVYVAGNLAYTNGLTEECLISGELAPVQTNDFDSCGGEITIVWEGEDVCGNPLYATKKITVLPAPAPTLDEVSDMEMSCSDADVYVAGNLAYSNGLEGTCNISGELTPVQTDAFDSCGGEITIVWEGEDICGNPLYATKKITVLPAPAPTLDEVSDMEMSCSDADVYVAGNLAYSNGLEGTCNISGELTPVQTNNFDSCGGEITIVWEGEDICGNPLYATKKITVLPAPAPTLDPVSDMEMSCSDADVYVAGNLAYSNGLEGTCNISGELTPVQTDTFDACGGEINIVWEGEDVCGNPLYATKKITVLPAPAPVILPFQTPEELSCEAADVYQASNIQYSNGLEGTCNISGELVPVQTNNFDYCGGTITIVWSGEDVCGNPLSTERVINVLPAPEAMFADAQDYDIFCEDLAAFDPGTLGYSNGLEGTCGIYGEVQGVAEEFTGACGTFEVTWTFTDNCARTITKKINITVIDVTAPELTGTPPDYFNGINECKPADALAYGLTEDEVETYFTDNCGEVVATKYVKSFLGDDCSWALMFGYIIKDECGNEYGEIKISYSGGDTSAPELVGDLPLSESGFQCKSEAPDAPKTENLMALYTDNCGSVNITQLDTQMSESNCDWYITYTFTVVDDCGNYADNIVITHTGQDTTAPELLDPVLPYPTTTNGLNLCFNDTYEGLGEPSIAEVEALYADNCEGPITVTKVRTEFGDDCDWQVWFRYTAYDECGNAAEPFKLIYQGGDTEKPVKDPNCEEPSMRITTEDGADCPTDAVIDLVVGETFTADSIFTVAGVDLSQVQGVYLPLCFTDNCTAVNDLVYKVTYNEKSADSDSCGAILTLRFVAVDLCGNESDDEMQCIFIIVDETAPVITCPEDIDFGLVADTPTGLADKANWTDICQGSGETQDFTDVTTTEDVVTEPTVIDGCEGPFSFQGFDSYGDGWNGTSIDVLVNGITVITAYDLGGDGNTGAIVPIPANSGDTVSTVINTDGNFDGEVSYVITNGADEVLATGGNPNVITDLVLCTDPGGEDQIKTTVVRTFTADDGCGNTANCDVTYTWLQKRPATCDFAKPIACGETVNGNTAINGEVQDVPTCGTSLDTAPGVWYVLSGTGDVFDVTADTFGSGFDTKLGVFEGNCGNLVCVGGNDDSGSPQSKVEFESTVGVDYYIYVTGYSSNAGEFTLNVTCVEPAPPIENDTCATAIAIACGQPIDGTTNGASGNDSEDGGCTMSDFGAWYTFVGDGGTYDISATTAGYDIEMSISSGECGSLSNIDCVDAAFATGSEVYTLNSVDGTTYYIYIAHFSSTSSTTGDFTLSIACTQAREAVVTEKLDFKAYPVPFNNDVTISYTFEFDTNVTIELFDTKGLLVRTKTNNDYVNGSNGQTKFDLSRTPNQMYYVKLTTSRGSVVKKIVSSK